jgi:predicted Zn-dependent protease with MMP-like domain
VRYGAGGPPGTSAGGTEWSKSATDPARGSRTRASTTQNGRVIELPRRRFEELVAAALDEVPAELTDLMDNVVVLVEEQAAGDPDLLGLYEGVALTDRGYDYGGVLPDRILIYRQPILAICDSEEDVMNEVAITVVHEIAHHFGIDDRRLHELGWA